jgi:hypothetical protein
LIAPHEVGSECEVGLWHFSDRPDRADEVRSCDREQVIWDTQSALPDPCSHRIARDLSKMLADCEVLYISAFSARLRWRKASYFEGGIRCSRQSNGTPDIARANG